MSSKNIDLTPQVVNLTVMRGDAWSLLVTFPFDLTGYTIAGQIRDSVDAQDATDLTITPTDLPAGKIHIGQLEATIGGYYDLQLTAAGGGPTTYLRGVFTLVKDVTR